MAGSTYESAGRKEWEKKDDYATPPEILEALGKFDLDPCASLPPRPWSTAKKMWTEDGLNKQWKGRVWLNPPYGGQQKRWVAKLAEHGKGTALVGMRPETEWFREYAWKKADAILALYQRVKFFDPTTWERMPHGYIGPLALVAYGAKDVKALKCCGLRGVLLETWRLTE